MDIEGKSLQAADPAGVIDTVSLIYAGGVLEVPKSRAEGILRIQTAIRGSGYKLPTDLEYVDGVIRRKNKRAGKKPAKAKTD